EILAINNHEFLVLERDNKTFVPTPPNASGAPQFKTIYKVDLNQTGVTDVSGRDGSLEHPGLPATADGSFVPLARTLVIGMLKPQYAVSQSPFQTIKCVIAEKVEGLAWGPDLPNGHHLLYVITDNDLYSGYVNGKPALPAQIYAFEIDG